MSQSMNPNQKLSSDDIRTGSTWLVWYGYLRHCLIRATSSPLKWQGQSLCSRNLTTIIDWRVGIWLCPCKCKIYPPFLPWIEFEIALTTWLWSSKLSPMRQSMTSNQKLSSDVILCFLSRLISHRPPWRFFSSSHLFHLIQIQNLQLLLLTLPTV